MPEVRVKLPPKGRALRSKLACVVENSYVGGPLARSTGLVYKDPSNGLTLLIR